MTQTQYIPALSARWLTPLFDPLIRYGMHEQSFKSALITAAHPEPGQRVLDLGCGTGTLTLMLQRAAPGADVTGIDPDPQILQIARSKALRAGDTIRWDQGFATDLPYQDGEFDSVVSSLVIHHLESRDKLIAFREVRRVLRRGGSFHIVDFGRPVDPWTRVQAALMINMEHVRDNFAGRLLPLLREAGFAYCAARPLMNTVFGALWLYSAEK